MANIVVYIEKEQVDHIRLTNDTGAALIQYEFAVLAGYAAVADEAIASGAVGSLHIEDNLVLQASDLVSGEDTFGTVNQNVYWDPSSGEFSDTPTDGYYLVGKLQLVKDSNGCITFVKNERAVLLGFVESGEIGMISYDVAADATTALSKDFGFNFTIIDAFVESKATNAGATIQLLDSSDNAISDAMIATPVTTITRVGTIDGATNGYNVIADGVVKFLANGAADRGKVWLTVKGA